MAGGHRLLSWLTIAAVLALPGTLRAHKLELEFKILPDRKVQIAGTYETLGRPQPAEGANVKIYRPDDRLLTEGTLDEKGLFTFSWVTAEDLKAVVVQVGHRESLLITAQKLDPSLPPKKDSSDSEPKPAASARNGSSHSLWRDLFLGVGFLLALAAFLIGLRNAAAIRQLVKKHGA